MPLKGGEHIVTAAWKQLNASDTTAFRQLTVRAEDDAASNIKLSADGVNIHGYMKTDESWTFGPNAGTITPQELWLSGTAADVIYYLGIPA